MEHQLASDLSSGREFPADAPHYGVAPIKGAIALIKHHGGHPEEFLICHIGKVGGLRILHRNTLTNGLRNRFRVEPQEGHKGLPDVRVGEAESEHES